MSELKRRAVHASGVGLPGLYLLDLLTWAETQLAYVLLAVVVTVLEFIRLILGYEWALFDELARSYERDNVAGYALYAYSQLAVVWLLVPVVAVPACLMLILGDPVSGYLGSNEAGTAKELGVIGVMYLVCFGLAAPFTIALVGPVAGVAAAAAGAAGATLADGATPVVAGYVIDDNITIPPAGAVGMLAVLWLAGVRLGELVVLA